VATASDDGTVKCFGATDGELLAELRGHEDAVQAVLFDPNGEFVVSCSSDHTFRLWS
jgi:WD40 repeat protein